MKNTIMICLTMIFNFAFAEGPTLIKKHINVSNILTESDINYFEQSSNMNYIYINMDSAIEIIPEKPKAISILKVVKDNQPSTKAPIGNYTIHDLSNLNSDVKVSRSVASVHEIIIPIDEDADISQYLPDENDDYLPDENDDYLLAEDEFQNSTVDQEFEREITQEIIELETNETTYFN